MKNTRYITLWLAGIITILTLFTRCEIDEPFPDPDATFEVWGIDPVSNAYEKVEEPYVLYYGTTYEFLVEGEGQQFVFWFGTEGDTATSTPSGSNFADRGENHYSKGVVAANNRAKYAYWQTGTFNLVFVASSYSYTEDAYKEQITEKEVEVIEAPAE